jgi:V/A-type H+-transporting ATPase subunit E
MSLDTVAEDIRDEARERREEIIAEAEQEADEIIAEAEQEADEIIAEAEQAVDREIDTERERQLSSATLEAKQERLEARREALDEAREAVENEVAALEGEDRRELTHELLADAVASFDDETAVEVYVRPEDRDLVAELCESFPTAAVAGETDCLGGVVAESEASRVRIDNTFDSVLDTVWEDNLRDVSARLFGET